MWAFGTSPHGLGLTADQLWGLCEREYYALVEQWTRAREFHAQLFANIRADLHNTGARQFDHVYRPEEFLPSSSAVSLESRVKQFIAQGFTPSQAAALASSKNPRERRLHVVSDAVNQARKPKARKRA